MCVPFFSNSVVRVSGRVVLSGLLFSAAAQASAVNWGSVQDISGPGTTTVTTTKTDGGPGNNQTINNGTNDVNEQGTMVLGVNFDGQPGVSFPYTTTIDGQNFYSLSDLPGGPSGSPAYSVTFNRGGLTNQYNQYTPGPAGQAYGVYDQGNGQLSGPSTDYTLANAIFGNSTTASFSVGNLTPGDEYLLQVWVSDPRNAVTVTRVETVSSSTGGDTGVPTLEYEGNGTDGQWVTGTFVADGTASETFDLAASNSNGSTGDSGSPQINLFQLRDLTPSVPEPASFALLGSGALALLARRRRV
jgi:PEP-CTERM motif